MGRYDFDRVIDRHGSNSMKWDVVGDPGFIPLWVADMDFAAAPPIVEALRRRVDHGVFGYTFVPDSYYQAIVDWFARRHQWNIDRRWIIYTSGVVPAVSAAIKALTMPGERVLVQTPVYNCFFSSIYNQGCQVLESPLRRTADSYEIDFDDFERKCADAKTTVFLLCNPHNPAGRVWTADELRRMYDVCRRHGVKVVSDEIHCEIVMPGQHFTPMAVVAGDAPDVVTLNSPTKPFNIAGLQIANIISADSEVYRHIDRAINIFEACDVNPFGVIALQKAYNECGDWLDELNEYIAANYEALKSMLALQLPQAHVLRLEGTYLAWVDIRQLGLSSDEAYNRLLKEARVMVNNGRIYGSEAGEGYIRINLACPRATLSEGVRRICQTLSSAGSDTIRSGADRS